MRNHKIKKAFGGEPKTFFMKMDFTYPAIKEGPDEGGITDDNLRGIRLGVIGGESRRVSCLS
jgi:hypothetical protein